MMQPNYTRLMEANLEPGRPMFKTIRIDLVCDRCRANGTAFRCRHAIPRAAIPVCVAGPVYMGKTGVDVPEAAINGNME